MPPAPMGSGVSTRAAALNAIRHLGGANGPGVPAATLPNPRSAFRLCVSRPRVSSASSSQRRLSAGVAVVHTLFGATASGALVGGELPEILTNSPDVAKALAVVASGVILAASVIGRVINLVQTLDVKRIGLNFYDTERPVRAMAYSAAIANIIGAAVFWVGAPLARRWVELHPLG